MKITARIAAACLGATMLLASGTHGVVAKTNIVVAFQGAVGSKVTRCQIEVIAKGIGEITGLEPELHAGGSAFATPRKLYPQLARGITDLSMMPISYTPGKFPLAEIGHLPFLTADNKAMARAVNRLFNEHLAEEFKGTHPLVLMALPAYQIHMRTAVEDISTGLKGKRIRVSGANLSKLFRRLGADVVGMPITQVYENMQKGVMDGFVLPNTPLAIFKQHEVSDYHIQVNLSVPLVYIGLSQKFWDTLPKNQQAAIDAKFGGPEAAAKFSGCFNAVSGAALKLAAKDDGVIRDASEAEIAVLKAHAKAVREEYLANIEARGLPARAYYEALKQELAKIGASR